MTKNILGLCSIGLINLILFLGIFTFLQNKDNYNNTLGKFSYNYERTGGGDNYEIKKVASPYQKITNENFENWDAIIYQCISEKMYSHPNDCYGTVRGAFFPLFPILWKMTCATPISISLINYFLFVISIALLVATFLNANLFDKFITYVVLISLPSTIVYYIPYSEALFLFAMTVTSIGIFKKKYWVFFIGALLTEMIRPAALIILFAIVFVEVLLLLKNRNFKLFVRRIFVMAIPFLTGFFIAVFIQYIYTSSWTTLFDAQKYWHNEIQPFKSVSDWSVEGFGLSVFSICFICLPLLFLILFLFFKETQNKITGHIFNFNYENITGYLFLVSAFYLAGIFIFHLLTRGGSLHSFFRYTLSTPLFYIALLILLNNIYNKSIKPAFWYFIISSVLLILFLNLVKYGGERMNFSFLGLYLFVLTAFFLIFKSRISKPIQIVSVAILVISNILWTSYLLNAFFCNAWVFT